VLANAAALEAAEGGGAASGPSPWLAGLGVPWLAGGWHGDAEGAQAGGAGRAGGQGRVAAALRPALAGSAAALGALRRVLGSLMQARAGRGWSDAEGLAACGMHGPRSELGTSVARGSAAERHGAPRLLLSQVLAVAAEQSGLWQPLPGAALRAALRVEAPSPALLAVLAQVGSGGAGAAREPGARMCRTFQPSRRVQSHGYGPQRTPHSQLLHPGHAKASAGSRASGQLPERPAPSQAVAVGWGELPCSIERGRPICSAGGVDAVRLPLKWASASAGRRRMWARRGRGAATTPPQRTPQQS
jgi:hypothetical protein